MSGEAVLLRGGRVVDPSRNLDQTLDVLLKDGVIAKVDEKIAAKGAEVVEAAGFVVAPGFVDLHTHLREPGFEYKETIASGTRAAAAGGFTTVCAMANTDPVPDDAPTVAFIVRRARETGVVRVFPIGAVSKGLKGVELSEIGSMKAEGIVAISDDGKPIANGNLMRRALEYASMFSLPVVVHEEDPSIVGAGVMNEGWASTRLGLAGWPNVGESAMVARDVQLAALTGARLHIAHVSTRESLEAIRAARRLGVPVTCEVTPHHLLLTDEDVARSGYDTRFKMNPPLRSEADRLAVIAGLQDGTIDCIATDHAPHTVDDKKVEYDQAANGILGLETAVALCLDRLVGAGLVDLPQLVALLSANPARVLGLPGGTLAPGSPADLTVLDLARKRQVDPGRFESRSRNTPFAGWILKGWPVMTIVAGRVAWKDPRP